MKPFLFLLTLPLLLSLSLGNEEEKKPESENATPIENTLSNMNMQQYTGKILKVYTAQAKSGARYNGYVVKWNDAEVVVTDMFGGETLEEGAEIQFTVTEMKMPSFTGGKDQTLLQIIMNPDLSDSLPTLEKN